MIFLTNWVIINLLNKVAVLLANIKTLVDYTGTQTVNNILQTRSRMQCTNSKSYFTIIIFIDESPVSHLKHSLSNKWTHQQRK
jgi:hypothetical protein